MKKELVILADNLDQYGLVKEADEVDSLLLKISQQEPQGQKIFVQQRHPIVLILTFIGLTPGSNNGLDFVNAPLYLKNGITKRNLLITALTITSLLQGMEVCLEVAKGSEDDKILLEAARLILERKEVIKSIFDKIKNKRVAASISRFVLYGELLVKYSDMMFETMRKWALDIVSTKSDETEEPQDSDEVTEENADEKIQELLDKI